MSTGFINALNFSNPTSSIITPKEEFKNEEEAKNFIKEAENALKSIESMGPTQPKTSQPKPAVAAYSFIAVLLIISPVFSYLKPAL